MATFNVCHGTRGKGTPVDSAALARACRSLDADVLALQELDVGTRRSGRVDQAALVAQSCQAEHVFAAAHRHDGGRFGNALMVRGTLLDWRRVRLPGRGFPGFRDRRAGLVASARIGQLTLTVAVAHLGVRGTDSRGQLSRLIGRMGGRPDPWILCGDLNLRPGPVRQELAGSGLTLVDAGGLSFPASEPRARIDHVAVRGLVAGTARVVELPVSDHLALVVDLELC